MSASGEHGRSAPGLDLRGKSVEELTEILERHEKLLSNQKFIAKLKDSGSKIKEFAEKVRLAIAERAEIDHKQELLSTFRTEFEAKKNEGENPVRLFLVQDLGYYDDRPRYKTEAPAATSAATKDPPGVLGNSEHHHPDRKSIPNKKPLNAPSRSTAAMYSEPDALLNVLEKISLTDCREEPSRVYVQRRNPYNVSGQKKSYFVDVIEKRAKNPVCKREKFKTNKFPPCSSSSSSCNTPVNTEANLSTEQTQEIKKKHLNDITAVTFPPLQHAPSKLISLEESISLQISQKQSYEDEQAKLAAHKLAERLHIKIGKFKPEGDSYMKYRDVKPDEEFET
uniref:RNA polymerase II subunit M n=1 Tax=Leptobrachium leishanense TaxID=445787 RepID=A0A8C5M727_9ANUR